MEHSSQRALTSPACSQENSFPIALLKTEACHHLYRAHLTGQEKWQSVPQTWSKSFPGEYHITGDYTECD